MELFSSIINSAISGISVSFWTKILQIKQLQNMGYKFVDIFFNDSSPFGIFNNDKR